MELEMTTFRTVERLCYYRVMDFDLKSVEETYERLVNGVFNE